MRRLPLPLLATVFASVFGSAICLPAFAQDDPFAAGVRTSPWLKPEDERAKLRVPDGFNVQLFASEPDINKPINIACDARGRIWVASTIEYPFPAPDDRPGRDRIVILEDADGDGHAEKATTFADGLNIPVGVLPMPDGGAIAFSIPQVMRFYDDNGDGVADRREPLLGGSIGRRDTHGMTGSFRRGYDGWIYAHHGFANESELTAKDGSSVKMQSGNIYRFRPDGSHIEQFAWGQVNPFGMDFDERGSLFSSDCHSKPISEVLRGAYYQSFGKPHDGLGFAPDMIDHSHGSTAICGLSIYEAPDFPEAFRGNAFIGNVMTSQLVRDRIEWRGASPKAVTQEPLIRSEDPWFRPVDSRMGTDGALYVADFYNRIIGHYEVDLKHPGRDRESGRIWRITYGDAGQAKRPPNLAAAGAEALIGFLADENRAVRMRALDELTDRIGESCLPAAAKAMAEPKNARQVVGGLWLHHRFGKADGEMLLAAAKHADPLVRAHAMRVISEAPDNSSSAPAIASVATDPDPYARRCAADAIGRRPSFEGLASLLMALEHADDDASLRHALRIALRNVAAEPHTAGSLAKADLTPKQGRELASVALASPNPQAAGFVVRALREGWIAAEQVGPAAQFAAANLADPEIENLSGFARQRFAGERTVQLALLQSIREGVLKRGGQLPASLGEWAADLVEAMLGKEQDWNNTPAAGSPPSENPWVIEERKSQDGATAPFFGSLPKGEKLTGVLRSPPFEIPAELSFWMAGHNGLPPAEHPIKNFAQLKLADTGEVIAKSAPPRNDTAQRFEWDLAAHAGSQGVLEIVDGDTAGAYAWLAVGRIEPPVASVPPVGSQVGDGGQIALLSLVRDFRIDSVAYQAVAIARSPSQGEPVRAAALEALAAIAPAQAAASAKPILADGNAADSLRAAAAKALIASDAIPAAAESLGATAGQLRREIALALAGSPAGLDRLVAAVEAGRAPAALLQEPAVDGALANAEEAVRERAKKALASAPPADERLAKLIADRVAGYHAAGEPDAARGKEVFAQHCAACHRIGNEGNLIGPQLDGIGTRGVARLAEDILAPSRNVDHSLRLRVITLQNGETRSGLYRRDDGATAVFADPAGHEFTIPKADIKDQQELNASLMPPIFGDTVPEADFYAMMGYLLGLK